VEQHREQLLRRLALNDEDTLGATLGTGLARGDGGVLDAKTSALVRLAALMASEAAASSYAWAVDTAVAAGATDDEVVDVLVTLAPIVGMARVNHAAPLVTIALGFDGAPAATRP
jgi:alkylhydroperoxidase/carboxymuconolactone decarboxylase family protein YurZ